MTIHAIMVWLLAVALIAFAAWLIPWLIRGLIEDTKARWHAWATLAQGAREYAPQIVQLFHDTPENIRKIRQFRKERKERRTSNK